MITDQNVIEAARALRERAAETLDAKSTIKEWATLDTDTALCALLVSDAVLGEVVHVRYWLDRSGALWKGPCAPDSTLHYATFEGCVATNADHQIWILRRSEPPTDAEEITDDSAERIITQSFISKDTQKQAGGSCGQ